jgi:hypothetical protein
LQSISVPVVGIDPGNAGGIAVLDPCGRIIELHEGLQEFGVVVPILRSWAEKGCVFSVERQRGHRSALASYHKILGALFVLLGILEGRVFEVAPRRWQSKFLGDDIPTGGTKVASVELCQSLWPTVDYWTTEKGRLRDGPADAALIALWLITTRSEQSS